MEVRCRSRQNNNLIKTYSWDRRSQPQPRSRSKTVQTLEAGSPSVAIKFQYKGTERTTELPLNLDMIGRLAWEAEFRNMSIAELIGELIMGMVKKDLFPRCSGSLDPWGVTPPSLALATLHKI